MRRRFLAVGTVVLVWGALSMVVLAQSSGTVTNADSTATVAVVLAPLLAAAVGIERLLETLWGIVESLLDMLQITPTGEKYVAFKTWSSAALSIVAGLIIASAAQMKMFAMLALSVAPRPDVFITGLVIGSGSKFTHDVIGIFTEGKRGLEQWRKLSETNRQVLMRSQGIREESPE